MSTHNICFHGEIRKILGGYPLLSVAMIRSRLLGKIQTGSMKMSFINQCIAPDKALFQPKGTDIFFYFSMKTLLWVLISASNKYI